MIFWKNEMVAHQMVPVVTSIPFWSSAIVSVISKWVKDGMKTPAEKIAKLGLPFPQRRSSNR